MHQLPAIHLAFRPPLLPDSLFGHLAATGVPGVEEWRDGSYRRTLRLAGGPGVVALTPGPAAIKCNLTLSDPADRDEAVARCRWLLDLDADPVAIDAGLTRDPVLAPLIAAAPGRRMPRCVDGAELALRTVLGQQVSTAAARTHAARLVTAYGTKIHDAGGGLTHLFPTPAQLAGAGGLALPRARQATFLTLAAALASGEIVLAAGYAAHESAGGAAAAGRGGAAAVGSSENLVRLAALPGIGPWTVGTVAMRALGDPDAFLPGDLGVRAAAERLGLPSAPGALTRYAARWSPWRAYAVLHLWGTSSHAVNVLPS